MFSKLKALPTVGVLVLATVSVYCVCFVVRSFGLAAVDEFNQRTFIEKCGTVEEDIDYAEVVQVEIHQLPMFMENRFAKPAEDLSLLTLNKLEENDFIAQIHIKMVWQEEFSENKELSPFSFALTSAFEDLYDTRFEKENMTVLFKIIAIENSERSGGIIVKAEIREVQGALDSVQLQNFFEENAQEMFEMFEQKFSEGDDLLEALSAFDDQVHAAL